MSQVRHFSSFFKTIANRLAGKQFIGKDLAGNQYFIDPKAPRRRWVEYPNQDILGNTATVPMTWHSWLRHGREEAPTEEELQAEQAAKVTLAAKVAAIKAADHKLRLQEMSEKAQEGQQQHQGGDMTLQQQLNLEKERDQAGGVSGWSGNSGFRR